MAKRTSRRNAEKESAWREALARQQASGLTVREFCRQHGLREPTFYFWRRTLHQRDGGANRTALPSRVDPPPPFVPVNLVALPGATSAAASGEFLLELRGGRTLRLPATIGAEQLAAIVRAIEGEVAP